MVTISSGVEFREWLHDKPADWAQVIAARAAMRALPFAFSQRVSERRANEYALSLFRVLAISWAAHSFPECEMQRAAAFASFAIQATSAPYESDAAADAADAYSAAEATAQAAYHAACSLADGYGGHYTHSSTAVESAAGAAEANGAAVWRNVSVDCSWLEVEKDTAFAAHNLTRAALWLAGAPSGWNADWSGVARRLAQMNQRFEVWIDWYYRRIRGEQAAFDIPGDNDRMEDKAILRRLAEATDEEIWGKSSEYVNTVLRHWIENARARVAPPPEIDSEIDVPKQEAEAIAYGVNADGKLDRLPHSDQMHLRDLPDQRRSYADIRDAALALIEEGQRLGPRLGAALNRFIQSLPDRFEDAEAYLVWRDGNALRRLHRAHRLVADGQEPDPARLEAAVAEGLGGLLDLYNNFAFADDGLRAKDEARVSPQERADAEDEARAAAPLIEAILATPDIATTEALDDIAADVEATDLPIDDPYSGQAIAQANRTKRNWVAGLLEGARKALRNPKLVGYRLGKGVTEGAGKAIGYAAVGGAIGSTYLFHAPILEFIATHAALLEDYVAIAYSGYPHLGDLIRRAKALWECWRS